MSRCGRVGQTSKMMNDNRKVAVMRARRRKESDHGRKLFLDRNDALVVVDNVKQ